MFLTLHYIDILSVSNMASSSSASHLESVEESELKCRKAELELKAERKMARARRRKESWIRKQQLRAKYKEVQDKIELAKKDFMIHSDTDTDMSDEHIWVPTKQVKLDIVPPSPLQRPSLLTNTFPTFVGFTNVSFAHGSLAAPTPPPAPQPGLAPAPSPTPPAPPTAP